MKTNLVYSQDDLVAWGNRINGTLPSEIGLMTHLGECHYSAFVEGMTMKKMMLALA